MDWNYQVKFKGSSTKDVCTEWGMRVESKVDKGGGVMKVDVRTIFA